MWRGLLGSTRDRGRGAARVNGSSGQPVAPNGREARMSPVPDGTPPRDTQPDASQRPNVSRETWPAAAPESWADQAAIDTPIGAEAERAVRLLHATQGRLPRPARQ